MGFQNINVRVLDDNKAPDIEIECPFCGGIVATCSVTGIVHIQPQQHKNGEGTP